jgi:aryl-alcohol dehydrogenase-like predicted oxidoreductase
VEERRIGQLTVSVIGVGCNQFGTAACDEPTARAVVDEALDAGITFFDTADEYGRNYADPTDPRGWGGSEEILGRALGGRRDQVVVATKFGTRHPGGGDRGGASPGWIRTAVEDSLRRLGTDRIDLYQLHHPDPDVPVAETLGTLGELVDQGKVREIGCSNLTGEALRAARTAADEAGLRPFASTQDVLNLFQRGALGDQVPACEELGMAFLPFYPLASGMLTGKYRRAEPLPSGTRLTEQVPEEVQGRLFSERTFTRLEALEAFAAERGHTLLELAFGWLLGQPAVASVIAGAARPGQAAANAACRWRLSPDEVAQATAVVAGAG